MVYDLSSRTITTIINEFVKLLTVKINAFKIIFPRDKYNYVNNIIVTKKRNKYVHQKITHMKR